MTIAAPAPPPASGGPVGRTLETKSARTKAAVKAEATAVRVRTVTGRVRDAKGRPLAGIRVGRDLGPARSDNLRDQPGSVATDREGTFVLHGIGRHPVSIILSRPRYQVQAEMSLPIATRSN